jgi:hypothetical protein
MCHVWKQDLNLRKTLMHRPKGQLIPGKSEVFRSIKESKTAQNEGKVIVNNSLFPACKCTENSIYV